MFIIFVEKLEGFMARPKNKRTITTPPRIKAYMPVEHVSLEFDPIRLNIEEFETIKLLDYEGLSQQEASEIMKVSRPTLTRIYENARIIIAKGLTEGRQIIIGGGKMVYEGEWHYCKNCASRFNNPKEDSLQLCPLCSSEKIQKLEG